jgi:hypothetical protein
MLFSKNRYFHNLINASLLITAPALSDKKLKELFNSVLIVVKQIGVFPSHIAVKK